MPSTGPAQLKLDRIDDVAGRLCARHQLARRHFLHPQHLRRGAAAISSSPRKTPAGPWSDPVWLPDVDGIDTSLFFDDGRHRLDRPQRRRPRASRATRGIRAIWLQQLDLKTLKTVGPKRSCWSMAASHPERNPIWIEGPHIFRKDGAYYLIAAEGGTEEQHSEVVFRSDKLTGPYVPFAGNPILTQRDLPPDRPQPITSTGHASFRRDARRATGGRCSWACGPTMRDNFNTGRETFLMPVRGRTAGRRITQPGERLPWVGQAPGPAAPAQAGGSDQRRVRGPRGVLEARTPARLDDDRRATPKVVADRRRPAVIAGSAGGAWGRRQSVTARQTTAAFEFRCDHAGQLQPG